MFKRIFPVSADSLPDKAELTGGGGSGVIPSTSSPIRVLRQKIANGITNFRRYASAVFGGHRTEHGGERAGPSAAITEESSGGSPPQEAQGWYNVDIALFTYSAGLMVGTLAEIKDAVDSWGIAVIVVFGVVSLGAVGSLGIGLMTAGYPGSRVDRRPRLSAFCARFSAILSTALFIIVISCKFGRVGRLAGFPSAAFIASIMIVVWVWREQSARKAISNFLNRLWQWLRKKPVAAQSADDLV